MVFIPEVYKTDCEPDTTKYGRFLKAYYAKKSVSKLKNVEELAAMSKLDFLNEYLLNDVYSLDDFLNIKNVSLRGFLYETIWDICIKCNVVSGLDNDVAYHIDGRIEELRSTKNAVKRQLRSLKPVDDMYSYFLHNKVQSGSSGGVSDITLLYRSKKKYILISSKFYTNEKSIEGYDIAKLQHAMKDTDTEFDIVLLVNDKKSLARKIAYSRKNETKKSMKWIYDKTDLEIYLNRLRALFRNLRKSVPRLREQKLFKMYFNSKNWRPLITAEFHNVVLNAKTQGAITLWNSGMQEMLISSVLYKISQDILGATYAIVCDSVMRKLVKRQMRRFFGFNYANIGFFDSIGDIKTSVSVAFVFGNVDELRSRNIQKVVFISQEVLDVMSAGIQGVSWNIENHMMLRRGDVSWMKPFLVEHSLMDNTHNLIEDYKSYADFHIYSDTREVVGRPGELVDMLFGRRNDYKEDTIMINRIKHSIPSGNILLFVPKNIVKETWRALQSRPWISKYAVHVCSFNSKSRDENTSSIIIAADDEISFDDLYTYVNRCYEHKQKHLILVELNRERTGLFKRRMEV